MSTQEVMSTGQKYADASFTTVCTVSHCYSTICRDNVSMRKVKEGGGGCSCNGLCV